MKLTSDSGLCFPMSLKLGAIYGIGDSVPRDQIPPGMRRENPGIYPGRYKDDSGKEYEAVVIWTGRKGKPKPGDWFLSGAYPVAYVSGGELSATYAIGELIFVTKKTVTTYSTFE